MIYCDVLVKVSFAKHTISVKKDSGVVEGDYNTTRLIFEFEEDVSNQRIILEMSNPKGELIFAKELSGNELVLAGEDSSGNICSIFNMEGLHPFELVLHSDTSKLTSATGYLPINKRQVNSEKGSYVEGYLPLFDELIDKVDQLIEMGGSGGSGHTHGDKTTLVPADEVSYTHKNIQDKSGTAQGALDEAITYVTEVLPSQLHSHKNSKVLENLADSNGELTYNGKPIGGSTERPTAEYIYDFVEDYRMSCEPTSAVAVFYIMNEEATDEEKAMVGREIADLEFERSTGKWVSMKSAVVVDFLPCISLLNRIGETASTGVESILFAAIYCPSMNWLLTDIQSNALSKIRITYYTD